jgi:RNA exonuclease 1
MGRGNKKRKQPSNPSSGPTLPMEEPPELPPVKFGDFKLTSNCGPTTTHTEPEKDGGEQEGTEWEPAKKKQKKAKKEPKGRHYPEMGLSPQKLKSAVKISDIQNLALWLVADGIAPQWLMVRVRSALIALVGRSQVLIMKHRINQRSVEP